MFSAYLLVCSIQIINACVEVSDTLGPYETQEECHTRIIEMAEAVEKTIGKQKLYYRCKVEDGYKL